MYEWFGLKKCTPTVGLYFFAEEYLEFLRNIKEYTANDIRFIDAKDSKHADILKNRGQLNVPVGVLGDIEIVFLHYKDAVIAKEKWKRRIDRINWNNIIYKFSYMNGCNERLIDEFESIQGVKKICFVNKPYPQYLDTVLMPYLDTDGQVGDDTFYWNRNFDIVDFINTPYSLIEEYWKRQVRKNV